MGLNLEPASIFLKVLLFKVKLTQGLHKDCREKKSWPPMFFNKIRFSEIFPLSRPTLAISSLSGYSPFFPLPRITLSVNCFLPIYNITNLWVFSSPLQFQPLLGN